MSTTLTNEQITAGAAILGDNGQPLGRNVAIMVFDAMMAASGAPARTGRQLMDAWNAGAKTLPEGTALRLPADDAAPTDTQLLDFAEGVIIDGDGGGDSKVWYVDNKSYTGTLRESLKAAMHDAEGRTE